MFPNCRTTEHFIPQKYNKNFKLHFFNRFKADRDVKTFLRFYAERQNMLVRRQKK